MQKKVSIPDFQNRSSILGTRGKKKSLVSTRGSPAQQLWTTLTEDRSEIGPETGHNSHVSKQETVLSYINNCYNKWRSTESLTHVPLPLSVSSTSEVKQDPSWPLYKWEGGALPNFLFQTSPEAGSMPKYYLFEHYMVDIAIPFCNQNHRWI